MVTTQNNVKRESDEAKADRRSSMAMALGRIPSGLFILTSRYEEHRTGMLVSWVQQVSFEPPLVCVTVAKGRPIMPLISDSRTFGLCQLGEEDKTILRKFTGSFDVNEDPFLGFELVTGTVTGVPILAGTMSYMECELTCHMDVEGDHDLFIGRVVGARCLPDRMPHVHVRQNGFRY